MIKQFETDIIKDLEHKKLHITREFNAPASLVWRTWTEPELLDKWWAPKPYKAITKSMNFKEEGFWHYYMLGPEGDKHWCRFDYENIKVNHSYSGLDAFCDEEGIPNMEHPRMHWDNTFNDQDGITLVNIEITFGSVEAIEKIIEMGFKEGFTMAHGNLDELLENLK
ncbi:MAG: SRPBCC domain-containing protein [Bacteroidota bacterium]